jgi:putative ABC transport system permease protein
LNLQGVLRGFEDLWEDLRNAARAIARQPRIAILSALILGLGIGLATAVYSIASGLILRGLPFPEAKRLVAVGELNETQPDSRLPVSLSVVKAWIEQQTTLEGLAYYQSWFSYLSWPNGGTDVYVGSAVAPELFPVLRIGARHGRLPVKSDCEIGEPVVVVSDAVWRDRFNRSPAILGSQVWINRRPHTVIGVMPPGFGFPYRQDLWTLLCPQDLAANQASQIRFYTVGRLRPGVSLAEAKADFKLISQRSASASAPSSDRLQARVEPYIFSVTDPALSRALSAVGGGAGLLLFVCCFTVALLLLLSTLSRQRSIAVRVAMGASHARLTRVSLLEALLLSAMGGVVGLAVAQACTKLFNRLVAPSAYLRGFWVDVRLDTPTFAVAMAATILAVPLCGLLSTLRTARTDPMIVLRRSSSIGSLAHVGWPGRIFVAGQVTLSCVLLVGAAITTSSGFQLARYPYGFDPADLFTAKLSLYTVHAIDDATPDAKAKLYFRTLSRVRALPGVREASVSSALPTQVRASQEFILSGDESSAGRRSARWLAVSPGFAATLGVPLLVGRDFAESDTAKSSPVMLVNRSFAKRFFGANMGVGNQVGLVADGQETPTWTRIVGVVGDSAMAAEGEADDPEAVYVPLSQLKDLGASFMYLLVRSNESSAVLSESIRHEIRFIDPNLTMWEPETLMEVFHRRTWVLRAFTGLFGVFGFAATTLACAGLYSIVALDVRRRRRELGIHSALGAQPLDIFRLVVKKGSAELAVGLILGVVLALALARRFASVFALGSTPPVLLWAAVGLLALAGGGALVLPVRHASKHDPMASIREEPDAM